MMSRLIAANEQLVQTCNACIEAHRELVTATKMNLEQTNKIIEAHNSLNHGLVDAMKGCDNLVKLNKEVLVHVDQQARAEVGLVPFALYHTTTYKYEQVNLT